MLPKRKSGTVGDNKDIKPLVTYLGETKVNFESDDLLSLRRDTLNLKLSNIKAI